LSSPLALIRNENMKIYRRPRTLVMIAILVGALILVAGLMKWQSGQMADRTQDWKQEIQSSIQMMKQNIADPNMSDDIKTFLQDRVKISEYQLANDINPYESTVWSTMNELSPIIMLVTILTIIVAADMIAAEFGWGTIKLLLIRPASRTRILVNKYIATLLFALFLLAVMFVVSFAIGGILEGFGGVDQKDLYIGSDGAVHERTMMIDVLQKYGLQVVQLVMYVTFAFMISAAFRSSTMAIAFSLLLMLIGNTVVGIFRNYDWIKYTLFANIDLGAYLPGSSPINPDMTLTFSIVVLAIYFVVFHLVSWILFTKRDVAA